MSRDFNVTELAKIGFTLTLLRLSLRSVCDRTLVNTDQTGTPLKFLPGTPFNASEVSTRYYFELVRLGFKSGGQAFISVIPFLFLSIPYLHC